MTPVLDQSLPGGYIRKARPPATTAAYILKTEAIYGSTRRGGLYHQMVVLPDHHWPRSAGPPSHHLEVPTRGDADT